MSSVDSITICHERCLHNFIDFLQVLLITILISGPLLLIVGLALNINNGWSNRGYLLIVIIPAAITSVDIIFILIFFPEIIKYCLKIRHDRTPSQEQLNTERTYNRNVNAEYLSTLSTHNRNVNNEPSTTESNTSEVSDTIAISIDAVKTDDESKQCSICMVNLKDQSLPCGHTFCVECVIKIKECSICKKSFMNKDVRKIYY